MRSQMSPIALGMVGAVIFSSAFAAEPEHGVDHPAGQNMNHADNCGMPMGEGVVDSIDVAKSKVKIAHKAIKSIDWTEMTMEFTVAKPVDLSAFAKNEKVHFLLKQEKDKKYGIAMMCSIEAEQGAHEACMKAMHEEAMKLAAASGLQCKMGVGAHDARSQHDGHGEKSEPQNHDGHH